MLSIRNLLVGGLFLFLPVLMVAQSPKKYCEAAEKFEKVKNYDGAIENYSKALEIDPKLEKAYIARAI
jgi:hypothetical protein